MSVRAVLWLPVAQGCLGWPVSASDGVGDVWFCIGQESSGFLGGPVGVVRSEDRTRRTWEQTAQAPASNLPGPHPQSWGPSPAHPSPHQLPHTWTPLPQLKVGPAGVGLRPGVLALLHPWQPLQHGEGSPLLPLMCVLGSATLDCPRGQGRWYEVCLSPPFSARVSRWDWARFWSPIVSAWPQE